MAQPTSPGYFTSEPVLVQHTPPPPRSKPAGSKWPKYLGWLALLALLATAIGWGLWLWLGAQYYCDTSKKKCTKQWAIWAGGDTLYETEDECKAEARCDWTGSWECVEGTGACEYREDALDGDFKTEELCRADCLSPSTNTEFIPPVPPPAALPCFEVVTLPLSTDPTNNALPADVAGVVGNDAPAAWTDENGVVHVGMTLTDGSGTRIFMAPSLGTTAITKPANLTFLRRNANCAAGLQTTVDPTLAQSVLGVPVCWGSTSTRSGFTRLMSDGVCEQWPSYLPSPAPLLADTYTPSANRAGSRRTYQ